MMDFDQGRTGSESAAPSSSRRRWSFAAAHAPVAAVLTFAIWTGFVGLDFGWHWGEPLLLVAITRAYETGIPLPHWYNYPSLPFDLGLAATAVNGALQWASGSCAGDGLRACMDLASRTQENRLLVRAVFLLVSLARALWMYAATLRLSGRALEATFAAALLALSWEVGYHARWIATDAIVMQFAALAILLAILHRQLGSRRPVLLAMGTVVGLATATKYPGALLAVPFVALSLGEVETRLPHRFVSLAIVAGAAAVAFIVTSPGTLLEYRLALQDIALEVRHYRTGHAGHTVTPGLEHLLLALRYLALVAFSHYAPIAAAVFALALVGAFALWRHDRRLCMAVVSFPGVFLLYIAQQRVMVVRNVLCVLPFLALLAAMGLGLLRDLLGRSRLATAAVVVTVAAAVMLPNAWWLHSAAETVARRHEHTLGELTEHILRNHETRFLLSPGILRRYAD